MTEQLSVTCYNAQQAHQAMTSQIWPMLKALTTRAGLLMEVMQNV